MMEQRGTQKKSNMEQKAMSKITEDERQSWYSIAFIWIGTMICIPMLMTGGLLSGGLTLQRLGIAALIGFGICCVIMVLLSIIGTDLGVPSYVVATKSFGDKGSSYLMSVIMFIGQLGWFGVQTTACATAFGQLLSTWNITNFPFWLSCVIWGSVMLVTAVYGFQFMKILNYIAVPALILMCGYGVIRAVGISGWSNLTSIVPEQSTSMTSAISTCIGLFAVGAVTGSDYSRYAKSRVDTVKSTVLGVLPAALAMLMIGAIMAFSTGEIDITKVFAGMGLPIISMLVLILATWTTNTGNAYMFGLSAMKITGLKDNWRPVVTLVCGIAGILIALTGLASALEKWIGVISSLVPSVAGVIIADYWILGKGDAKNWYVVKGFNWIGIIAWALGSIVALFFSFFSQALDSIIVSFLAYLILIKLFGSTALAGQGRLEIEE